MLEHFCHDEFIILYSLLITFSLLFCRSKLWRRAKCFAILNSLVGSSQLRFGFDLNIFIVCACVEWEEKIFYFVSYFSHPLPPILSLPCHFMSNIYFASPCLFICFYFVFSFSFLQSDVSGEVIKILREDGGEFGVFGCLFIVGFFCKFHFICSHLVCFALQILLDMVMLWLQSFHHFLE